MKLELEKVTRTPVQTQSLFDSSGESTRLPSHNGSRIQSWISSEEEQASDRLRGQSWISSEEEQGSTVQTGQGFCTFSPEDFSEHASQINERLLPVVSPFWTKKVLANVKTSRNERDPPRELVHFPQNYVHPIADPLKSPRNNGGLVTPNRNLCSSSKNSCMLPSPCFTNLAGGLASMEPKVNGSFMPSTLPDDVNIGPKNLSPSISSRIYLESFDGSISTEVENLAQVSPTQPFLFHKPQPNGTLTQRPTLHINLTDKQDIAPVSNISAANNLKESVSRQPHHAPFLHISPRLEAEGSTSQSILGTPNRVRSNTIFFGVSGKESLELPRRRAETDRQRSTSSFICQRYLRRSLTQPEPVIGTANEKYAFDARQIRSIAKAIEKIKKEEEDLILEVDEEEAKNQRTQTSAPALYYEDDNASQKWHTTLPKSHVSWGSLVFDHQGKVKVVQKKNTSVRSVSGFKIKMITPKERQRFAAKLKPNQKVLVFQGGLEPTDELVGRGSPRSLKWLMMIKHGSRKEVRRKVCLRSANGYRATTQKHGLWCCLLCKLPLFSSSARVDKGDLRLHFQKPFDPEHILIRYHASVKLRNEGNSTFAIECARCCSLMGKVDQGSTDSDFLFTVNVSVMVFQPHEALEQANATVKNFIYNTKGIPNCPCM